MKYNITTDYTLEPNQASYALSEAETLDAQAKAYARQGQELSIRDPLAPRSYLDTPVVSYVSLYYIPGALKGIPKLQDLQLKELVVPVTLTTAMFDISRNKNITEVSIRGRNGTIKEFVSYDNFKVNIRGKLVSKSANIYPEIEVVNLRRLCSVPHEIGIVNPLLNALGILNVIVDSYQFPMTEGYLNVQEFTISCTAEETFAVRIKKENES